MSGLPHSPAAERNRGPIADALAPYLSHGARVLEFGAGAAQHARHIAQRRPDLQWQTTDRAHALGGLTACVADAGLPNLAPPRELDLRDPDTQTWLDQAEPMHVCLAVNVLHIVPMDGVAALFGIAGHVLDRGGHLCAYGPVRIGDDFDGEDGGRGNAAFDRSLREQDSRMGVRDIEQLDAFARAAGLSRTALTSLPANNRLMVWQKSSTPA